jgi:hypothetical protein
VDNEVWGFIKKFHEEGLARLLPLFTSCGTRPIIEVISRRRGIRPASGIIRGSF